MTTGMQINSTALPAPMDERGDVYLFQPPPTVARNGAGLAVTAGVSRLTWRWASMSAADFAWWTTTLLGGAASVEFTQAKFMNHLQTLTTYTHCIVHRPTFETVRNGLYINVTVEIEQIT